MNLLQMNLASTKGPFYFGLKSTATVLQMKHWKIF